MSQPPVKNRFYSQLQSVITAFEPLGVTFEVGWLDPEGERRNLVPDLVLERGKALCRTGEHLAFLMQNDMCDPPDDEPRNTRTDASVKLVRLSSMRDEDKTMQVIERINGIWQRGKSGDIVVPHHLVSICGNATLCPADEPVPAPHWPVGTPRPPQRQDDAGRGVRVLVLDTGLIGRTLTDDSDQIDQYSLREVYPWLAESPHGLTAGLGIGGGSRTTAGPPEHLIAEYRGHGTFIAGVLKSVAPGADVTVMNVLHNAGAELELDLGNALMAALDTLPEPPDIISLSAGSVVANDRDLLGLTDFMDSVENSEILLVAAAGNDGGTVEFWPAAKAAESDWVLAVGALRYDGMGRACFSNYGDWVEVYAPGERLVNAFDTGTYKYFDARAPHCRYHNAPPPLYAPCTCTERPDKGEERSFDGMAEWSGTSFATPIVAGRVAAYMTEHHITNARDAAQEIRMEAHRNAIRDAADDRLLPVVEPRPPMDSAATVTS